MLWLAGSFAVLVIATLYAAVARQDRLHGGTARKYDKEAQRRAMTRANSRNANGVDPR